MRRADSDTITTGEMNRKHHCLVHFYTDWSITVLSWFQAVSPRTCTLDDTGSDLLHAISSSTSANTGILYRVVPSGLTNYWNMCLIRRSEGYIIDVAFGAGEQGDAEHKCFNVIRDHLAQS